MGDAVGVLLIGANNAFFNELYLLPSGNALFLGGQSFATQNQVRKKRPFKEDPLGGFLLKDPPPP